MRVLALNAGSSSLKFRLFAADARTCVLSDLVHGAVRQIGDDPDLEVSGSPRSSCPAAADHGAALERIVEELRALGHLDGTTDLATGHRIVHGGSRYREPTLVTGPVIEDLRRLSGLAPLHNAAACAVLEKTLAQLGPRVPAVAVFDTAFHARMPPWASEYALPWPLARKHDIRRFGFHGLAHQWMSERWAEVEPRSAGRSRVVTLQLGHGCSAAAVRDGRSLDVTMGFTPLEGLMSSTRSGDVDPAIVPFLSGVEDVDASTVAEWLNTRSGLLGVSGTSSDIRALLAAEARGDERARVAVEMFCYRVRKSIGAMAAVLCGVDAIVFSGGIGENSPDVRARVTNSLGWLGVRIDPGRNAAVLDGDRRLSSDDSPVAVWVLAAQEEILIGRAVLERLQRQPGSKEPLPAEDPAR